MCDRGKTCPAYLSKRAYVAFGVEAVLSCHQCPSDGLQCERINMTTTLLRQIDRLRLVWIFNIDFTTVMFEHFGRKESHLEDSLYIWQDRLKEPEKLWTPAIARSRATNPMKNDTCRSSGPASLSECRTVYESSMGH